MTISQLGPQTLVQNQIPQIKEPANQIIQVVPWRDPLVDVCGLDLRSDYVELFWLPILGPTTTWLMRRFGSEWLCFPDGFTLNVEETSRALGLGARSRCHKPIERAIDRCCRFGLARKVATNTLGVRRRISLLSEFQVHRLSAELQGEHCKWENDFLRSTTFDVMGRKARTMALQVLSQSSSTEDVVRLLGSLGVHPSLCFSSAQWAWTHFANKGPEKSLDQLRPVLVPSSMR